MAAYSKVRHHIHDEQVVEGTVQDFLEMMDQLCFCGQPGTKEYEGQPWCGKSYCAYFLQQGLDYHYEVGNR